MRTPAQFIAITLFLIPVMLPAQDIQVDTTWNQTGMNGEKQGFWRKYYESGGIRYQGFFKDDRPVGRMTRYHETGAKMADIDYSPDGISSYAILYYQDGSLAAEGKFVRQEKDSTWKYYSYYSKNLSVEENYAMGRKHGVSIVFYENGQLAQRITWRNDMKHGPWEQFYEDSVVRLTARHENDKLEGSYQVYNTGGILIIDGAYSQDQKTGTWKYYLDDGSTDFELIYADGVLQNEEVMKQKLDEFMEQLEKNSGTIPEPDPGNFIPH